MNRFLHFSVSRYFLPILFLPALFTIFPLSNTYASEHKCAFVENAGQITDQYGTYRDDIDFKTGSKGISLFIGSGHMHYQWYRNVYEGGELAYVTTYRLDVALENANPNAEIVYENPIDYYEKYYTQYTQNATAHSYEKITYKNIYPGIDWVLKNSEGGIKYDFIVHEGADYTQIKIKYTGADKIYTENGMVKIETPYGSVVEGAPYTYVNNTTHAVPSRYDLQGNTLGFQVEEYTDNIVIDPSLEWATYIGDTSEDYAYAVTYGQSENLYAAGYTASIANIATNNAHQDTLAGQYDGLIQSYTPSGVLKWSTYYGGAGTDLIFSIARNSKNEFILGGTTDTSFNLSYSPSGYTVHQPNHGGGISDCFILKIDSNGNRIWCSYYGGAKADKEGGNVPYQAAVTTDDNDNIYFVATTLSDTGIATNSGFQSSRSSSNTTNYDAFLVKLNDSCQRQWATYYGGTSIDNFRKVYTYDGRVYVAGVFSSSGMSTSGTNAGSKDALLAAFDISTGNRIWAKYFGGSNDENVMGLYVHDYNIYLCGSTLSSGIATSGVHQTQFNAGQNTGSNDAFLAKFDTSGQRLWSTYYGGGDNEHGGEIITDAAGNIIVSGTTASSSNIHTPDGHKTSKPNSDWDAYLAIFNPLGSQIHGTYFGGADQDYGYGVTYTPGGYIYLCGQTSSSGIAVSGNINSYKGDNDGFLAKFTPDTTVFIFQPFPHTNLCVEDTFSIKYGVTAKFASGNTFTAQLSNASGSFTNPTNIGSKSSDSSGYIFCTIPGNLSGTGFRIRIVASNPTDTSFDNGSNITIKPRPVKPTAGSNSPVCSNDTLMLTASTTTPGVSYFWLGAGSYFTAQQNPQRTNLQTTYSGSYIVTATLNGCSRRDTISVTILQAPDKPIAAGNTPLCTGDTLQLSGSNISSGATVNWNGPNSYSSNQANPTAITSVTLNNAGNYVLSSAFSNGCVSRDTAAIVINQSPNTLTAGSNSPICSGDTVFLTANSTPSGVNYSWTGPGNFSSSAQNPIIAASQTSNSGDYILTGNIGNCSKKDTINVVVNQSPAKPDASANGPLCSGENLYLAATNISTGSVMAWQGPASYTSNAANDTITNVQVSNAGDYIFTATLNGCSKSDTASVSISQSTTAKISINVTPGTLVCPTTNLSFTVSPTPQPGTKYIWTGPNGWSDTAANPTRFNIAYADSGYYNVKTFTGQCTKGDTNIFVRVTDTLSPPVTITNSPVCEQDTIEISYTPPNGISKFIVYKPNGSIDSNFVTPPFLTLTEQIFNANSSHAGNYIVKVEAGGCTAYDTVNMIIKTKPNKPTVSNNGPVCEGDDLQLNSNGSNSNITYEWSGPSGYTSTDQNPVVNNVSPTLHNGYFYSNVVLDGCASDVDSTMVLINPNPVPDILSNMPVCEGKEMKLFVIKGSDETYTWESLQGGFTASGDTAKISTVRLTDEGIYIVAAKNNVTGCVGYDSISFTPVPLPGNIDFLSNSPVCMNDSLLINTSDTSTNVTYQWNGPGGYSLTGKNLYRTEMEFVDSGYYYITANRDGCTLRDSINITVKPTPDTPILQSNSPVNVGEELKIEITNPDPNAFFEWRGPLNYVTFTQNASLRNVTLLHRGYYQATTTIDGCSSSSEIFIDITDEPTTKGTLILYPNPNNGNFTIGGELSTQQEMPYEIINAVGMVVYTGRAETDANLMVDEKISIESFLASGVYFVRIVVNGDILEIPFTIVR